MTDPGPTPVREGGTDADARRTESPGTERATDRRAADRRAPDRAGRSDLAGPLVVVCGLPGVGKSTVARAAAERVDGDLLRTDVVRKELFPEPTYSAEETAAVYAELCERAGARLADGEAAVLDGTFKTAALRADARAVAEDHGAPLRLVKVECPEPTVRERIERRDGVSDADFDIHRQFREEFEPVPDAAVVDNSGSEAETVRQVDALFDRPGDGLNRP